MNILYEKINALCQQKGITGGKLCGDINIQRSLITDLKMERKQSLSSDTLNKIANYFDVSIDYLLGNEPKEKQPLTFDDFTYAMYEQSQELTDEDKKQLLRMAEFMRQQRGL